LLIAEGERAADAATRLGLAAVGICIGAPKVPHRAVLQPLADRFELVMWPDRDPPGHQLADQLGRLLRGVGIVLRVLEWPDARLKDDAADFLVRGGTRDQVLALIEAATTWRETRLVAQREEQPRISPRLRRADAALARARNLSALPRPQTYDISSLGGTG
jgi:hypothetical protein